MRSCRACTWQVDIPTDWAYEGQGRVGAGQAGNCDLRTLVLEDATSKHHMNCSKYGKLTVSEHEPDEQYLHLKHVHLAGPRG